MSARDFEILYKETRLNLEPTSPSLTVQYRVGSHSSSFGRSITSRSGSSSTSAAADEKAYRTRNLATASSIYYRKFHASPRGFHWRVLENDTILSIRAADVCKEQNDTDAPLILNLRFTSPIRTSCIGFADPEEHDVLCIYVVDQSNQLHSITLRPDHFRKKQPGETGLGDACKSYSPPGFHFKHPHRLAVVNPYQLIVTMHDGGILRFDKNRSHEGRMRLARQPLTLNRILIHEQLRTAHYGKRPSTMLLGGGRVCVDWFPFSGLRRCATKRSTWRSPRQRPRQSGRLPWAQTTRPTYSPFVSITA